MADHYPGPTVTVTLTLRNASLGAIERNLEAQRRVIDGKPLRACDHAPLLDTESVLKMIKHEITR